MANFRLIRETVERAVGEVLDARMGEMRRAIVSRVARELEPALTVTAGSAPTDLLNAAVKGVQEATSQADILRAMLDGAARFSKRCGLLVLRGTTATGWQARGFGDRGLANNDAFRTVSVDASRGLTSRVLNSKLPAAAAANEFDPEFLMKFGAPADGNVSLLPLVIKEKVAALLYADGGDEGLDGLDSSALELLVRSTGIWVELLALRKSAPAEALQSAAVTTSPVPTALAHPQPTPAVQEAVLLAAVSAPVSAPAISQLPVSEPIAADAPLMDPHEDPVHAKALRFAKLLVDEIKLYNQTKVSEGRSNRDLYDRLKDDIDKSRSAYEKRYGATVSEVNYFRQELVRILADNDVTLLGQNFPR